MVLLIFHPLWKNNKYITFCTARVQRRQSSQIQQNLLCVFIKSTDNMSVISGNWSILPSSFITKCMLFTAWSGYIGPTISWWWSDTCRYVPWCRSFDCTCKWSESTCSLALLSSHHNHLMLISVGCKNTHKTTACKINGHGLTTVCKRQRIILLPSIWTPLW